VREPEWTEQDRAEALALALYRSWLCPGGCGQPLRESTTHYETGPHYEAKRIRCRACDARAEASALAADKKVERPEALLYSVIKIEEG
jgi:hypothetical protein